MESTTESTTSTQLADVGRLLPCPFCGGEAELEPHPSLDDCARAGCGNSTCAVRPATEYLLRCFVDELHAAWNQRAEPAS
jgi:hypothetical protein